MSREYDLAGGKTGQVIIVDRPGGSMWDVREVLRGMRVQIKPDAGIRTTDSVGTVRDVTTIAVLEEGTGRGVIQFLCNQFLSVEIRFGSYAQALGFCTAMGMLADEAGAAEQARAGQ